VLFSTRAIPNLNRVGVDKAKAAPEFSRRGFERFYPGP
jgi:hypothetical protein